MSSVEGPSADQIRRLLDLAPHPEGGWYRETFRDASVAGSGRAASTAIFFMLADGEVSRWHRVDAAEVWHHYAGAPLELRHSPSADVLPATRILGSRLDRGELPQIVVPKGDWQQARPLGPWTLAGCTVAPGFMFEGFEMAAAGFEPGGSVRLQGDRR